jgi:biotin transport system substrate-specific component
MTDTTPALRHRLIPAAGPARLALDIGLGVCFLTASAKITVPFWPVPMTLQTLAVLMIGALQGRRAPATVATYLALGALGLPVFAQAAAGPLYMAGPTGGYLAGFLLAAAFLGRMDLVGRARPMLTAASLFAAGLMIVLCGAAWLSHLIGVQRAVAVGVVPFIAGDLVKVALATAAVTLAASRARHT